MSKLIKSITSYHKNEGREELESLGFVIQVAVISAAVSGFISSVMVSNIINKLPAVIM